MSIHSILCDWFKLSLCDEITMLALIQVLIIFRICSINVWESQVQPPGNSIPIGQETMKVASKIRDLPERRNTWPKPMGRGSLILWINAVSSITATTFPNVPAPLAPVPSSRQWKMVH